MSHKGKDGLDFPVAAAKDGNVPQKRLSSDSSSSPMSKDDSSAVEAYSTRAINELPKDATIGDRHQAESGETTTQVEMTQRKTNKGLLQQGGSSKGAERPGSLQTQENDKSESSKKSGSKLDVAALVPQNDDQPPQASAPSHSVAKMAEDFAKMAMSRENDGSKFPANEVAVAEDVKMPSPPILNNGVKKLLHSAAKVDSPQANDGLLNTATNDSQRQPKSGETPAQIDMMQQRTGKGPFRRTGPFRPRLRSLCAVTANVGCGSGSKVSATPERQDILTEIFRGRNPDIIFLQECKLTPANLLDKHHLNRCNWTALSGTVSRIEGRVSHTDARITWRLPLEKDTDTSQIVTNLLTTSECNDAILSECRFRNRVQLVVLQRNDFPGRKVLAISWHGPEYGYKSLEKKKPVFFAFMSWLEIVKTQIKKKLGVELPLIVGGDFNFPINEARKALESGNFSYILPKYTASKRREHNCVDYFILSKGVHTKNLTVTGIDLTSREVLESLIEDKKKVKKFLGLPNFPPVDHDPVYLGIQSIPVKVSERELMKMKKIYPYCSLCEYLIFYEPEKRQPEEETEDSLESIAIALQQLDLDEEEQDGNG